MSTESQKGEKNCEFQQAQSNRDLASKSEACFLLPCYSTLTIALSARNDLHK